MFNKFGYLLIGDGPTVISPRTFDTAEEAKRAGETASKPIGWKVVVSVDLDDKQDDLELRAMEFATRKHEGQKRKYTGENYIVHPKEVAAIVYSISHTPAMLAAAWLHDTVEDTNTTLHEIGAEFGGLVRNLVYWLTDSSTLADGNRAKRKTDYCAKMLMAPTAAKTVKLADLISNTRTIVQYDPNFAVVYMREKVELLNCLKDGDAELWMRAHVLVADYRLRKEKRQ